jgi:c-di-GMP-binding flagellar brake protein YcgR
MSKSASSAASYEFSNESYKSPAGIMLHSRTVVEKKDYVSTGMLTYAEGDILEIELPEYKLFELGDHVKLTVYSPGGIYMFHSTVVAKDHGALMVINPPHNQNRFAEKRENPRVMVSEKGKIQAVVPSSGSGKQALENHIELRLENISISGIGFTVEERIDLTASTLIEVEVDLGIPIPFVAEIVRQQAAEGGVYYGARYVNMLPEKANSVRAFVLKKQVENYFVAKRSKEEKRRFK